MGIILERLSTFRKDLKVVQWWRTCLPMQETWVWSQDGEDPLEEEKESHSSILAGKISWTEEPGGL